MKLIILTLVICVSTIAFAKEARKPSAVDKNGDLIIISGKTAQQLYDLAGSSGEGGGGGGEDGKGFETMDANPLDGRLQCQKITATPSSEISYKCYFVSQQLMNKAQKNMHK